LERVDPGSADSAGFNLVEKPLNLEINFATIAPHSPPLTKPPFALILGLGIPICTPIIEIVLSQLCLESQVFITFPDKKLFEAS
jgi:hypothetical protein